MSRILLMLALLLAQACVMATMKGMNQIVTPDIQPAWLLSVSPQLQDSAIGNCEEMQLEYGLSSCSCEVALFEGISPRTGYLGFEAPVLRGKNMFSVGSVGPTLQPFAVAGRYFNRLEVVAGTQRQSGAWLPTLGASYQVSPTLQVASDYEGGRSNFLTLGFTQSVGSNKTLNPALFLSNSRPRRLLKYSVLTWNIKL